MRYITKRGIKIPMKPPKSKDDYYISQTGGSFELRQKRFHDRLVKGQHEHPHDVVAVHTSKKGIIGMRKYLKNAK